MIEITKHAVKRYQERVLNYSDETARFEIESAFAAAKAKHKRVALKKRKNTAIVPCNGFFLICSHGKVVTVVKELRGNDALSWPRQHIERAYYDSRLNDPAVRAALAVFPGAELAPLAITDSHH